MENTIYTIGHSNKSFEEFLTLLQQYHIQAVADVRRFPGSKKFPHFNKEILDEKLSENDIQYLSFPELGGRRKPDKNSINDGWKNEAFKGYADYMESKEFLTGIDKIMLCSEKYRIAIMCSEVLWWRCHRRLISDFLTVRGYKVVHILSLTKSEEHHLIDPAKVKDGKLYYGKSQIDLTF
jgi:uncharacterized protein (DUF488 family)